MNKIAGQFLTSQTKVIYICRWWFFYLEYLTFMYTYIVDVGFWSNEKRILLTGKIDF